MKTVKSSSIWLRAWPILALLLLIAIFLNKMAFSNLILARGDTFLYFYPYWHAAANALRAGRFPLWNPNIFMGAPLLANSQVGFFYPFNWPVWLLFDTPYAVSASILLHLSIAGIGAFLAGRRVMLLDRSAAFVTALAFALGGYLTAQVEHVNQLQGLAWLPWLLFIIGRSQTKSLRQWLLAATAITGLFTLQLLAGHTQTTFISAVALFIWILAQQLGPRVMGRQNHAAGQQKTMSRLSALAALLTGGLLALLLASIQLLPTLELTGLSSRQGGLPVDDVLSFSLHPLLLTRSLLPAYGQSLFTEYVAFLPLTILTLAFIGAWQWRKRTGVLPALIWVLIAFLLAFGVFNPLNWLLARLPGFNLFRVPARWLVLYALGAALLAGVGWQVLVDQIRLRHAGDQHERQQLPLKNVIFKPLLLFLIIIILLVVWGFLAGGLVEIIPTGLEAPYEAPSLLTLVGWMVELALLALFFFLVSRGSGERKARILLASLTAVIIIFLFASSRPLPYNNLTTPEAYFDLRPPVARLMTETADPPGRLISLSDIFFDTGDQAEIDAIYVDQLSPEARYDYTIAIKQKEVIAPNLPMIVGLASVDGFDGGVLPIQSYTEQMKLILPEGVETTDGRLREHLDVVPEARWLDHFNANFLLTDKTGDTWRDGVFFDRQHPVQLERGQEAAVGYVPEFEATELRLLASQKPGTVTITTITGQTWEIAPEQIEQDLYLAKFPEPAAPLEITVTPCQDTPFCDLFALTLVDDRNAAFQSLVPGQYRMIHSGDVKIYENLDVMPRAYLVADWQWVEDTPSALELMRSPEFDPKSRALLLPQGANLPQPLPFTSSAEPAQVEITDYRPEKVVIKTDSAQDALLILTDANYPGWQAKIDDQPIPIYPANILFRSVFVPAGSHELVFTFEPRSFQIGLVVTLAILLIMAIILAYLLLSGRNRNE